MGAGAPKWDTTVGMAGHASKSILIVEDEAPVRRMAVMSLQWFGYRVLEAANGPEALRQWEQHRAEIALLFTDMVMPEGMTGLDLAKQ